MDVEASTANPKQDTTSPFFMSKLLVSRPRTILTVEILLAVTISIILWFSGLFEFSESNNGDFLIYEDFRTHRQQGIAFARLYSASQDSDSKVPIQTDIDQQFATTVVYESTDGKSLLTPENLMKMYSVEKNMMSHSKWSGVCLRLSAMSEGTCAPNAKVSITDVFMFESDGSINQTMVDSGLAYLSALKSQNPESEIFTLFGKEFLDTMPNAKLGRATFLIGLPFGDDGSGEQFLNAQDRVLDQVKFYRDWAVDVAQENEVVDEDSPMQVYVVSNKLFGYLFSHYAQLDMFFAFGSICFVFFYIAFHTGSFFLASVGMLQILLAFPVTYLIYRGIFQIKFFMTLHTLAIFIILGIGADDIFVFWDAWEQSIVLNPRLRNSMLLRMSWSYKRAAKAMLATTVRYLFMFIVY